MIDQNSKLASVYTDFSGLNKLKSAAAKDTPESRLETAQQFEALFIQMMLKSMRQASQGDELLGGQQMEMSRDMYDQQLAIDLASKGAIGIADLVMRQMGETISEQEPQAFTGSLDTVRKTGDGALSAAARSIDFSARLWGSSSTAETTPALPADWKTPQDFVRQLQPAAETAAQQLGTRPEAVLAIAALETGWGQHVIPGSNGASSNNLFGIKANRGWQQERVVATTLEFEDGVMQTRREPFRSYASAHDSVQDFADFVTQNPRYQPALAAADNPQRFVEELHKAGYATDPDYAQKVVSVMQKISVMTQDIAMTADK